MVNEETSNKIVFEQYSVTLETTNIPYRATP